MDSDTYHIKPNLPIHASPAHHTIPDHETLYAHPSTGASTEFVEILRRDRLEPTIAETARELTAVEPGLDGKLVLMVRRCGARRSARRASSPAPSSFRATSRCRAAAWRRWSTCGKNSASGSTCGLSVSWAVRSRQPSSEN